MWVCRRAIPLAIALLNVSKPDMNALDTLSRLSHDADSEVAQSAVLALGAYHTTSVLFTTLKIVQNPSCLPFLPLFLFCTLPSSCSPRAGFCFCFCLFLFFPTTLLLQGEYQMDVAQLKSSREGLRLATLGRVC